MRERFYDHGVIDWPGALTNESLQLAQEVYHWSLDHPGPGAGDITSKNPGTFYQDLANPEVFSVYETLIKHPDILAIIRKLFSGDHAWFMYEQVFKKMEEIQDELLGIRILPTCRCEVMILLCSGFPLIRSMKRDH